MDNNEIKFDPLTGQPINNNKTNTEENNINKDLQSIATIDQSKEKFINNVQQDTKNTISKADEKSSYIFMVIIFAIIFVSIFFLFPIISKYI